MAPLRVAALESLTDHVVEDAVEEVGFDALTVGRRIRHHRQARGLTLAQLGEAVGAAQSQLSQVENGKREPRLSLITSIARALEVAPAELLDPAPPPGQR